MITVSKHMVSYTTDAINKTVYVYFFEGHGQTKICICFSKGNISIAFYGDSVSPSSPTRLDNMSNKVGVLMRNRMVLPFESTWFQCVLSSLLLYVLCFVYLCSVSCAQCCPCFGIVHFGLLLWFSLKCVTVVYIFGLYGLSFFIFILIVSDIFPISLFMHFVFFPTIR